MEQKTKQRLLSDLWEQIDSRILDVRSEQGNNEDSTQQSISAFSGPSGMAKPKREREEEENKYSLNECLMWAPRPCH